MRLRFRHNTLRFIIRYSGVLGRRIGGGTGGGGGTGPRDQRNLGEAVGTLRNDACAHRLWVAYRKSRDRPAAICPEELVDAESIIIDLCRFTASRFIPINFDENLQRPQNSDSNRLVTSQSLEKYIGKIIKYFREVYPEHPDWRDLDPNDNKAVPQFWKNIKPGFRREIQMFHLLYKGDGVIGLEDIRPLYYFLGLDDEDGKYPHRLCDLKHIFIHLIKNANAGENNTNCQRVAIILSIAEAIGRGGEAKFQTFRDWYFDSLWKVTNTPWKEKKTIQAYAMARVADENWYKDWYCAMGMFALCEDGLYRSPSQKNAGLEQVVFPLLYGRKDEGATTIVTESIRSGLPADVKKFYSAKSLRQGGINQATKHKDMNYFFLSALTGHAGDNNSSQYYIDPTDVGRTVPALNALHGRKDLKTPIAIPTLDALGSADKATAMKFMDKVFKCNIPSFMERGDLHIVKETFLASLLMHHRELITDCTTLNRVSSMLLDRAKDCVFCAESPHLPVDRCLLNWCDKIKAHYKSQLNINELKMVPTSERPSCELLASMAESIKSLTETVAVLNEKFDDVVKQNAEQASTISLLHERNLSLRDQVDELSMIVARRSQQLTTTPEGGRSNPNKRPRVSTDVSSFNLDVDTAAAASETSRSGSPVPLHTELPNTATVPTTNMTDPTPTATNPVVAPAPAPAPSPTATTVVAPPPAPPRRQIQLPLRHGHSPEQASKGKKSSMKNNQFSYHLALLAQKGAFRQHSKLAKGNIPSDYSERSHVVFCLELVDYVAEHNAEVQANVGIVRNARTRMSEEEELALSDAADEIVSESHRQLNEFKPSKRATGTTILGMGKRIGEYKNRIKNAKNLPSTLERGDVQLISVAELEQLEYENTQRHMGT